MKGKRAGAPRPDATRQPRPPGRRATNDQSAAPLCIGRSHPTDGADIVVGNLSQVAASWSCGIAPWPFACRIYLLHAGVRRLLNNIGRGGAATLGSDSQPIDF